MEKYDEYATVMEAIKLARTLLKDKGIEYQLVGLINRELMASPIMKLVKNKEEFDSFIRKNRNMLDDVSIQLMKKMEKDYDNISLEEFRQYTYDPTKGGFEALHYFRDKGFIQELKEGFRFFQIYDCPYSCVEFPDVPTVIEKVHEAGGIAVMAHPGVTIPHKEPEAFKEELLRYVDMGVEGIECYYPLHPKWMEELCVEICKEKGLYITAGSDCHGGFGNARIGETQTPVEVVTIKNMM